MANPPSLRNAVMALYYGAKVVVTTTDREADPFDLSPGILQEDTCITHSNLVSNLSSTAPALRSGPAVTVL